MNDTILSWEEYRKHISYLKKKHPQWEFEGNIIDNEGNPVNIFLLFQHAAALIDQMTFENVMINPNVVFSVSPVPNALASPSGNGNIRFNLGIPLAILSLENLTTFLKNVLPKSEVKEKISLDYIESINISRVPSFL